MTEYIVTCDEETASWIGNDVDSMRSIVRCRDCKHGYKDVCERPIWGDGERACVPIEPDGYCAWGKRKEGGE